MMNQSVMTTSDFDILVEPTLTELIDNNKKVLANKIKPESISRFISVLMKNKHERYVKLLNALCVCNNEAILENQNKIIEIILKNKQNKKHLIHLLRKNKFDEFEIYAFDEWINLIKLERENDKVRIKFYNYFCSMIELTADLCLDKNFLAIDELKDIYTFKICFLLISTEDFFPRLRRAFLK